MTAISVHTPPIDAQQQAKRQAADKVLPFVQDGMILGLGTGSTIDILLPRLKEYLDNQGYNVTATTTSVRTRALAEQLGFFLIPQNDVSTIDLCIDGTDEFDKHGNLIKGGGGALLCEKIIAQAAKQFIVVTDESKFSEQFGRFSLPIEIVDFELGITFALLKEIHAKHAGMNPYAGKLRQDASGKLFRTDMNHLIMDIPFLHIQNPQQLAQELVSIAGVVEHGLFLKQAHVILTDKRELYF